MSLLSRIRPLDAVIAIVAVLVLGVGLFLGYSVWENRQNVRATTPAALAVEGLERSIAKTPNDIGLRVKLAQAYSVAGRDRDAVKQYKVVLTAQKDHVPALTGLGFIALKQKEYRTGEGYYRKIVDVLKAKPSRSNEPLLENAYFYLATALMEQKQYEEAASYYKAALRLRRDASDTHYALAVTLRELGADDGYRESLENALLFDPKMPEANYDYGLLLLADGDNAGAAEHFRSSTSAAPGIAKPREELDKLGPFDKRLEAARALMKSDPEKALIEARIAAALEPDSVDALVVLGLAYEESGDKKKATEAYRRALARDANSAEAKSGLERVTDGS